MPEPVVDGQSNGTANLMNTECVPQNSGHVAVQRSVMQGVQSTTDGIVAVP